MSDSGLSPKRRFSRAEAFALAAAVSRRMHAVGRHAAAEWTRPELSALLGEVIEPSDAEEVARAVLAAFPKPPPAMLETLTALIADLRAEPTVRHAQTSVSSPIFDVPRIDDVSALAGWFSVSVDELDWFAARGRRSARATNGVRHYRVWRVPKRHGGFRLVEAPKVRLATMQRRIVDRILVRVPAHPSAHGFVRGRSAATFGSPHALHDTVIRVDLRHCFEHVTRPRVLAVFRSLGYPRGVASYLTALCTTALAADDEGLVDSAHAALLRERRLPQGAPTSPYLVNLVLRRLDIRVAGFAAANGLRYTRYGDDLALSGDAVDVGKVLWTVARIVDDEGFRIHPEKTRVMGCHQRQQLAGLVVNAGPRARRADFDELKALLHNAVRYGARSQNRSDLLDFRGWVYGRIGWVSTGSAPRRAKLLALADRVDWDA